jgi:hypothetical protein
VNLRRAPSVAALEGFSLRAPTASQLIQLKMNTLRFRHRNNPRWRNALHVASTAMYNGLLNRYGPAVASERLAGSPIWVSPRFTVFGLTPACAACLGRRSPPLGLLCR